MGKPLTLAEKILYALMARKAEKAYGGVDYVDFGPDRGHTDATTNILQFMQAGKEKVAVPSTAHADHLIQAKIGADKDLQESLNTNNEVFNFLSSVCNKRHWFLEARSGYYTPGGVGELRFSRWHDDWDRFAYRKCRWFGNGSHRSRWR